MRNFKTGNRFQGISHQGRLQRQIQKVQPEFEVTGYGSNVFRRFVAFLDFRRNGHTVSQAFFEEPKIKSVNGSKVLQLLMGILPHYKLLLSFLSWSCLGVYKPEFCLV